MHRHGYKGRKLHRERDQRKALIKSLAESLIIHETIQTTEPKAKELVPYVEKLITKAKKGDLHSRRQLLSSLQTVSSAHKLVDEIAPKLKGRTSGHLRIENTGFRRGDRAAMARVSFVDDLKTADKTQDKASASKQPRKQSHESSAAEEVKPAKVQALPKTSSSKATRNIQAPKRTGRRGDR